MSWKHLGEVFDIHGGGIDLVFPHHENEIAQTCCAFGHKVMANIWMHNGFLQVEGQKMSKRLGNFLTIRELLDDWPGEVLRFNMLRTHYRQPIDWTVKGLEESGAMLEGFFGNAGADMADAPKIEGESVLEALNDDLNTPKAIAELHALEGRAQNELGETLNALGFTGKLDRRSDAAVDESAGRTPDRRAPRCPQGEELGRGRPAARRDGEAWASRIKDNKDGALVTSWELKR